MEVPHIFTIRGLRVMLDFQLAALYGIETKVLNQAVKRHSERFDQDFMFQLDFGELAHMRSQIVTACLLTPQIQKSTSRPYAFTELGVAMLSSVLQSSQAIEINKGIMRTFFRMRSYLVLGQSTNELMEKLERESLEIRQTFSEVFERLDNVELVVARVLSPKR